jgi:hypothetical protein
MSTKSLQLFFTGKTLIVPGYQRDYAWKERNIDDLFGDVEEALEVGSSHYLGTFILSQRDSAAAAQVVDGQQRLTTLTMVLDALIAAVENPDIKQYYRSMFISNPVSGPKFQVLGDNEEFFRDLLSGNNPAPESDGQNRLRLAHRWIHQRVQVLLDQGGQGRIQKWLECLSTMEVLEFIEPNEGKAIRMFQSVNDRGVPLARMDIVKSLLVYYSNRYLDGALDVAISKQFGRAFRSFSRLKQRASETGFKVRNIDRDSFREDDVLRYHYLAFDGRQFGATAGADYSATSETVLEVYLKPTLQRLRNDPAKLQGFIETYAADLTRFFAGLELLVDGTRTDRGLYMLFVMQDLSTTLYPLVIRLELMGWLRQVVGSAESRTLLEVIEMADLRVFKLRGTNPQADICRITRELPGMTQSEVVIDLQYFCQHFMSDGLLSSRLIEEDLYRNLGLMRMLLDEEDQARAQLGLPLLTVTELAAFNGEGLTAEHILPQQPNFDVTAYGFADREEYEQHKHRIGNLVLLEGPLNSACNNRSVEEKMSAPNLYHSSKLCAVTALAAAHMGAASAFSRPSIRNRASRLADIVVKRWPIELPLTQKDAAEAGVLVTGGE